MVLVLPRGAHAGRVSEMNASDIELLNSEQSFLLLDGALLDALKIAYKYDHNPSVDMLYRGTRHQPVVEVSPCLIKPSERTRLWDNQELWRSKGIVVVADCGPEILADHFRSLLSVRMPDGTVAYLRFYVPSQIQMLLSVFTDQETAAFSGVVRSWRYFDEIKGWVSVDAPETGYARMAEDEGWFQLQQNHLNTLGEEKHRAFLRRLARSLGLSADEAQLEKVAGLVAQAQEFGFASEANIAGCVELFVRFEDRMELRVVKEILGDTHRSATERWAELDRMLTQGGV